MILSSRQKELILWMFGVFTTVGVLLAIALPLELERETQRQPASLPPVESNVEPNGELNKDTMLKGTEGSGLQGKGSGSLKVLIENPGKRTMGSGSATELQATIEALSDLSDLEFKWLLPDGVTAESGAVQGSIGRLALGEKTQLNLTIANNVSENRRIHLHVFRKVGDESMGEIAQYNTMIQEKIDDEIEKRAEVLKAEANPGKELDDGEQHHPKGLIQ